MENQSLKLLRYNTGTDKKAFIELKEHFDAVIFNSTIVAYSGSSVADLVSMHKNRYIIDPQTHIFQQDIDSITADNKKKGIKYIKKSVEKYLGQLPSELSSILIAQGRPLLPQEVVPFIDQLVNSVVEFQTKFVNNFIKEKDYEKYLKFAHLGPEPKMVIAPYFMLKDTYSNSIIKDWLEINSKCLQKTLNTVTKYKVAAQLVLDKNVLCSTGFVDTIKQFYNIDDYEYIFIWIDDFNSFEAKIEYTSAFFQLIKALNSIGKKPIMAYGGYESIILCNKQSPVRMFGVAQSVGYGEYRPITPVGGGLPTNKYYFPPLHKRLRFSDAAEILSIHGYFSDDKSFVEHAKDYHAKICNCKQCLNTIQQNINNFDKFNDSTAFSIPTKNGPVLRNKPTTDAELIAALHFLYCKVNEWRSVEQKSFSELICELMTNYNTYYPQMYSKIVDWCKVYECKAD